MFAGKSFETISPLATSSLLHVGILALVADKKDPDPKKTWEIHGVSSGIFVCLRLIVVDKK